MAVITSTILLTAIAICLISKKIMVNAGYKLLSLLMIFTLLRFLFPFDFPFSTAICIPDALSTAMRVICHAYIYIGSFPLSIWNAFCLIWLAGSLVRLFIYVRLMVRSRRYLLAGGQDITEDTEYHDMLEQICKERRKRNSFRILKLDNINTPMIYGIFKPCILIPTEMKLSSDNLYYTLSHEAAHHFHHDLLIKAGINILSIVYWWNPAVYVLKKQTSLLLEMRVDSYLTGKDETVTKKYLECLIEICEYAAEQHTLPDSLTLSFHADSSTELEKRFIMLCNANKPKRYLLNVIMLIVTLIIYILSYVFIFEPYYFPTEVNFIEDDDRTEYYLPLDNTYIIENADGTYSIYLDTEEMPDYYLETLTSLEHYTQGIPVYYLEKYNYK
jgi:beta-lactamase regulating signal transducer with metallopeptidase domain